MKIAEPAVHMIGHSSWMYTYPESSLDSGMRTDDESSEPEDIIEFAGRSCYQSFHKPNPATEANADYIANIIEQGHHSVLEHSSATFYLTGVSRALTHELIRHRHLSYSQQSQRFVDESDASIVIPPALVGDSELVEKAAEKAFKKYAQLVENLTGEGLPRKQAREAARAVLPNCVETRIVVTGNFRAWRDMLFKRLDKHADAEIRLVSGLILDKLMGVAPSVFQDVHDYRMEQING